MLVAEETNEHGQNPVSWSVFVAVAGRKGPLKVSPVVRGAESKREAIDAMNAKRASLSAKTGTGKLPPVTRMGHTYIINGGTA